MHSRQIVLIIGTVWPEPNSSAAGSRMMQLISLLQASGCHITFCSTAALSEHMANLKAIRVNCKVVTLNSRDFDDFIVNLNPSIVLFDRFLTEEQFGWRVTKHCPKALKILDLEDLHCLRRSRQKAIKQNREFVIENILDEDDAKREVSSILRSDLTLVISEFEMEVLTKTFKVDESLLHYLPLLIDQVSKSDHLPLYETRKDFIFIGNFFHEPNVDAVKYLNHLWPEIHKQLPNTLLRIYGAYPSEAILQMHNPKSGFHVHGRIDDAVKAVKNSRIVLAPIRFGAGIKGKLLEAMQCGTPSITTSAGAEAMNGDLAWNGFITDDPKNFIEQSVKLYDDRILWEKAQKNGLEIIKQRYMKSDFADDFLKRISDLQVNIKRHRKNNFIGSMLQFHTMRSTEYLSRWIEEKNKRPISKPD